VSDKESDVTSPDEFEGEEFDDDDEVDDDVGNRVTGAMPRAVLDYVARQIVDDPEAVVVELEEGRRGVTLRLHVAPDDMGRVIGRRGRVAHAIRTVVRAAAAREGLDAQVDIVD
jgi:predicted RNA-binding protein YlqC (UPF0109 family)